jgi:hypothetical protein
MRGRSFEAGRLLSVVGSVVGVGVGTADVVAVGSMTVEWTTMTGIDVGQAACLVGTEVSEVE